MPAFFDSYFWSFSNPELWVGVGLLLFVAILVRAGVPKMIAAQLDAKAPPSRPTWTRPPGCGPKPRPCWPISASSVRTPNVRLPRC